MLTTEQLRVLHSNKKYKKTRRIKYNWKLSKSVVACPDIDFNITLDFSVNGNKWQQISIPMKLIIFLFHRFIMAKEIGAFRNKIFERAVDQCVPNDFDILPLITNDMKWVSPDCDKMKHMRNFTVDFFTNDPNVRLIVFELASIEQGRQRAIFLEVIAKIKTLYNTAIAKLWNEKTLRTRHDYTYFLETKVKGGGVVDVGKGNA